MAQHADVLTDRFALRREIEPQNVAAPTNDRHQSGAQPQQRCLPGAVRSTQQHDLALVDRDRRPGQRGERAENRNSLGEFDHGHAATLGRNSSPTAIESRRAPASFDGRVGRRGANCRTWPRPASSTVPAPARLEVVGRRARQDADHAGPAHVRIRRLPAVGHRDRDREGPERTGERIRGTPRFHDDRPMPGRFRDTVARHRARRLGAGRLGARRLPTR